jgi:uncharacterized protein (DUF433 family)
VERDSSWSSRITTSGVVNQMPIAFDGIYVKIRQMSAVTVNPKVQGGLPCFTGTRVPVSSLFDHLQRGYTVEQFIEDFPTVAKEQVDAVLEMAKSDVPNHAEHVNA